MEGMGVVRGRRCGRGQREDGRGQREVWAWPGTTGLRRGRGQVGVARREGRGRPPSFFQSPSSNPDPPSERS